MTHAVTVTVIEARHRHLRIVALYYLSLLIIHYQISVAVVGVAHSNLNVDILNSSYDVVDKAIQGGQHMSITWHDMT
jgi:hypothetical protein